MEITLRKLGQALFFAPAGRLTVDADLEGLHAAARENSDRDIRGVFLDLENVTRLDCWGIGQLVRIRGQVDASGRTFGLVNVNGYQRRLLELLRLTAFLGVCGSRREALASVAAATQATGCGRRESRRLVNPWPRSRYPLRSPG